MREQSFEIQLRRSLHQSVAADEKHFESTLLLAREEAGRRRRRTRVSFGCFLFRQMKFIGWRIWGAQGIFLLAAGFAFANLYAGIYSPVNMAKLLLCLSVLVFMTALPFLYRSVRWRMQEIEAASRFSSVRLLAAKLIVIGVGDVCALCGIFFMAVIRTSLRTDSALLYLCFPFLLVCGICLFMLGHFTPGRFLAGSMGVCCSLLFLFSAVPGQCDALLLQSFSGGGIIACAALFAFCVQQFRYIIHDSPYTEMQVA